MPYQPNRQDIWILQAIAEGRVSMGAPGQWWQRSLLVDGTPYGVGDHRVLQRLDDACLIEKSNTEPPVITPEGRAALARYGPDGHEEPPGRPALSRRRSAKPLF